VPKAQPATFEELYEKLQDTLRQLEDGNLPLDKAITLFEEGSRLADECRRLLSEAELRVRKIEEDFATRAAVQEPEGDYLAARAAVQQPEGDYLAEPPPDEDALPF
jgi:exodeoxyribonuclease VII small subunit